MASSGSGGTGSPCGACKFLRRKCASDCIFAPYFCSEQGPARFAAIHKVFGASNVSKLLLHVPVPDRCEAVVTIAYEAQARIRDPVYGCVAHIFALQQQSSLESVDLNNNNNIHDAMIMNAHREIQSAGRSSISSEDFLVQACTSRKRPNYNGDLGELQALAFRMMRN
ncbi:hypothetical protein L484_009777 [Morus notabilis]|uniref:LOB domain-containing protein n=1 Tax=Morus notabilis TaxID=981085 RepID=W9SXL7_9ROSA|nr:hypothetical protein L484_009777 [Morus notabilis]